MLRFSYVMVLIAGIIYMAIYFVRLRKYSWSIEKHLVFLFTYVYICKLIDITFFPIPVLKDVIEVFRDGSSKVEYNIIPFRSIFLASKSSIYGFARQVFGNILLFVPMGYLLPLLNSRINSYRNAVISFLKISLSIESVQLILSLAYGFSYRYADIDDLILNVMGGTIGFMALKITLPLIRKISPSIFSFEDN